MNVDVAFTVGKVYNVDKSIDVAQGQVFTLSTDTASKWYADNDTVLDVDQDSGKITAKALGTSSIIMTTGTPGKDFVIWKEIVVTVVAEVDQAASLGATAGPPIPK